MSERQITVFDIRNCAQSGEIKEQKHMTFIVSGNDLDGQRMNVICDYFVEVIVVTAFYLEE
jgi:hypothetical protein